MDIVDPGDVVTLGVVGLPAGAVFAPGGSPSHDLQKHRIWVCPMYEPFLNWLYKQDLTDLDKLPAMVNLKDAEFVLYGHRRPGPEGHKSSERLSHD